MGKTSNLVIGTVRGKVGSVVGYALKNSKQPQGVRVYQPVVANPKSVGQREQRARFATLTVAGGYFADVIDHSFEGVSGAVKNRGRFLSLNNPVLKVRDYDFLRAGDKRLAINPYVIAQGSLPAIAVASIIPARSEIQSTLFKANPDITSTFSQLVAPTVALGNEIAVVTVLADKRDVMIYPAGGSAPFNGYPVTCMVVKHRFTVIDDSKPLFVRNGESNTSFLLNPEVIDTNLSEGWEGLTFSFGNDDSPIFIQTPVVSNFSIVAAAVIQSQRVSDAKFKYSTASLVWSSFIDNAAGTTVNLRGVSMDIAKDTYLDAGGSSASELFLNNAQ